MAEDSADSRNAANDSALATAYRDEARHQLAKATAVVRHCLNQLSEEQLMWRPHDASNSVGNLILHLCGNVRQWIISGVGGAMDQRDRPAEFSERGPFVKDNLREQLDQVLAQAELVLQSLTATQLLEHRRIQGFETTRLSAVFDSVAHFKGHTQEIVCLTRMQRGDDYEFEWVPATPAEGA